MKKLKRIFLTLCMITCFFALTACGSTETRELTVDESLASMLCEASEATLQQIVAIGADDIQEQIQLAEDEKEYAFSSILTTWNNLMGDTGNLVEILDSEATRDEDGYVCVVNAQFEKRPVEFTLYYDAETNTITSMSLVAEYTMGENMERAALNTLMGMGTVFLVLIFISCLIYCFRYINVLEQKIRGGHTTPAAPAPASAPVQAAPEEEELTDDLELVAVITAAIAASEGTSTDGLVVRSIKRAGTSRWKRA